MNHHFKSLEILLSVDNVGERFEIERGGDWSVIASNIAQFVALKKHGVTVKLAPTVNLQNVLYLEDVVDLANQHDVDIVWWYLDQPAVLSIEHPTARLQHVVVDRYQDHPIAELRAIARRMQAATPVDGREFLSYQAALDTRRSQHWSSSHREIFELMGGCETPATLLC